MNITWHPEPSSSMEVGFGREQVRFVNAYTGETIGTGAAGLRKFFGKVEDWHRWLGVGPENRKFARAITDGCNLAFLFLVCSGIFLWWPRKWAGPTLRGAMLFKSGLSGKPREFNWHNVIGFWCCVPLFVVVLCSVVMSYPWASDLVYRVAGDASPPSPQLAGGTQAQSGVQRERPTAGLPLDGLDQLSVRAERRVAGWQSINLRLPATTESSLLFSIDTGNGGQPARRSQLTLDRKTGTEVRWEPYSALSRGRRWRMWMRFAHTGEVFGLLGQGIAGLASLGAAFLVYTGISMALRRLFA